MPSEAEFTKETIEQALKALGEIAVREGKLVEISVYGGSALLLTLDARVATRDVDAVFERDKEFVRTAAEEIAEEKGWSTDWLNDAVKGFLSPKDMDLASKHLFRTYPSEDQPGLRVQVAAPEYLFAMKAMAMRMGGIDEPSDIADLRSLGEELGITRAEDAISLVSDYYPDHLIAPKTRFGLEELFGQPGQDEAETAK